ncbi:GLPGLI family protein [Flavobacterium qiangtangense]|uniref:GLPGLI family protein n=1 Tax=Flavobacterium qiangtangense TaxID=1442595 RepID=A0ABW1PTF7_9FLAO
MKTLIFLIFFSINFNVHSQTAIINYQVIANDKLLDIAKKASNTKFEIDGVDNAISRLEYQLEINKNTSYFYLLPSLDLEDKKSKFAKIFAGSDKYFSNGNEIIKKTDYSGKTFNISLESNYDWKLSNETKMINNYLCYKATLEAKNYKGAISKVIAWYSPKIPFNFGPKGYSKLPGLILELQDKLVTYLVSKVQLNNDISNRVNLKKENIIQDDDVISEDKFHEIIEKVKHNITQKHKD